MKKKIKTIDELNKVIAEVYEGQEWELKVEWDNSPPLTKEKEDEYQKELEIVLNELKKSIGNFIYGFHHLGKYIYLSVSDATDKEKLIKNYHIFQHGKDCGNVCAHCPLRVECLLKESDPCENEKLDKKNRAYIKNKFSLNYNKENAVEIIQKFGFEKYSIFQGIVPNGYEMETNLYRKEKMTIELL